jgi:hypothetical protein
MSPTTAITSATPRQLRFLKSLAEQTATSFTYPKTRGEASLEIKRLLALKQTAGTQFPERRDLAEPTLTYATAIQPGEVTGFGSTASWRKPPEDPPAPAPAEAAPRIGVRTELARYTVSGRQRVLYGQRINGRVRITDRPASGAGRSYLVERDLQHDGHSALNALVADYTQQAQQLGEIPMASSVVRRQIEAAAA